MIHDFLTETNGHETNNRALACFGVQQFAMVRLNLRDFGRKWMPTTKGIMVVVGDCGDGGCGRKKKGNPFIFVSNFLIIYLGIVSTF